MAKNIIAKKHPVAGFTLIELLVTVVIIGILVGIGVVSYNGIIKQNRQKDLENSLIDAAGKVQNYISKNNYSIFYHSRLNRKNKRHSVKGEFSP